MMVPQRALAGLRCACSVGADDGAAARGSAGMMTASALSSS
jgi:hypothetical protein